MHKVRVKGRIDPKIMSDLMDLPEPAETCQMDSVCTDGKKCIEEKCREPITIGLFDLDGIKSEETLQESIEHGGSAWEMDLYGKKGAWDDGFFLVAYREGEPCPVCATTVQKIKTGSTSSYICPVCQPLAGPG